MDWIIHLAFNFHFWHKSQLLSERIFVWMLASYTSWEKAVWLISLTQQRRQKHSHCEMTQKISCLECMNITPEVSGVLSQAPFFLSNRHFHRSLLLDTCKAAMLNHHNSPKNYSYKTLQTKWKQNKFAVHGHKKVHSCCSRTLLTDVLQLS